MLYDPKWEKPQTNTVPTLEGFAAWLEQQPDAGTYNYYCADCAIGQYLTSLGFGYMEALRRGYFNLLSEWNQKVTSDKPHTFGAALARARAVMSSHLSGD